MKKSELTEMIREIVKEEISKEIGNAFRYMMKESYSPNRNLIREASGNTEDYENYPTRARMDTKSMSSTIDRDEMRRKFEEEMGKENGGFSAPKPLSIPNSSPDGRHIDLRKVDKSAIDAVTRNYSGFMKTLNIK